MFVPKLAVRVAPWLVRFAVLAVCLVSTGQALAQVARPNILWITCEDISADLGCYGRPDAVTPHLDRLASQSVRYTQAFATIGVCAPARSSIITGLYPPSIGTHHMRCRGPLPPEIRCFTEYLREAGYYCTNNVKTDYNFDPPPEAWDESSRQAHWRNRAPNQPFFAVINLTTTHEGQVRMPDERFARVTADLAPHERHDPDRVTLPPYHPDTPEVRRDWARYHDLITVMDRQVADILEQLEADGLADETIVFFYSDHGAGLPRSKRWLYDSSLNVPLLVRFPKRYRRWSPVAAGETTDRLVSFVDFGPTVLSLAGIEPPEVMQGEAFLGPHEREPREYVYGFRDRMDERSDMLRAVRDGRYKYIRNWQPHLPWFRHQHLNYQYEMPTMQAWQRLADAGELSGPAAIFMAEQKPVEELYDTWEDPWEVNNLAGDPQYGEVLERMRDAARSWSREIIDLGFLPEAELRSRFDEPPYAAVRKAPQSYPLERIMQAAEQATSRDRAESQLIAMASDEDAAVRYWAAVGLGSLPSLGDAAAETLGSLVKDRATAVRIAAADALYRQGAGERVVPVLAEGLRDENDWARLQAAQALDRIRPRTPAILELFRSVTDDENQYVGRIAEHALGARDER